MHSHHTSSDGIENLNDSDRIKRHVLKSQMLNSKCRGKDRLTVRRKPEVRGPGLGSEHRTDCGVKEPHCAIPFV